MFRNCYSFDGTTLGRTDGGGNLYKTGGETGVDRASGSDPEERLPCGDRQEAESPAPRSLEPLPPSTATAREEALCRALSAQGFRIDEYRLASLPGSPCVGSLIRLASSELAFRVAEPDLLLLVYHRRHTRSSSLRNPFADLIAFLLLATRPAFGIGRVMGQIRTEPHPDGGGLSDHRLTRFYERFFRAERTRYDFGEWLYSDIEPLRRRLAEVRHQAAPRQAACGRIQAVRSNDRRPRQHDLPPATAPSSGR